MQYTLKDYYKRYRKFSRHTAQTAIAAARDAMEAGKPCYAINSPSNIYYNPSRNGRRWIENPSQGLRDKGFADEQGLRSIDHKGWFVDDLQSDVYRGQVFQLPAHKGKERFLAAFADPYNDAAYIDFSTVYDCAEDAARAADSMAEYTAEEERNYSEAYHQGSRYADLGAEVKESRSRCLALIREIKAQGKAFSPAICDTLKAHVRSYISDIKDAREKRDGLKNSTWTRYYAAFNEGAGEQIFKGV